MLLTTLVAVSSVSANNDRELGFLRKKQSSRRSGIVVVKNRAPIGGTCLTPVWVGIHAGTFDTYDRDMPISAEFERLVEDGNNGPISELFAATEGTVWDGTVGDAPICPGEKAILRFSFDVVPNTKHYFSYASMILPSNDAFVANGNPTEHLIVSDAGRTRRFTFIRERGSDVLDGGSEVNDEIPANTAFFGQEMPDTGIEEGGVVTVHPGFNPKGSGGILDSEQFENADFTARGYKAMDIKVFVY